MPLHVIVLAMLTAAIKHVNKVWIGSRSVVKQVALEMRDGHGPEDGRTATRQVTIKWTAKNDNEPCVHSEALRLMQDACSIKSW